MKPFYLETNIYFGHIENQQQLDEITLALSGFGEDIYETKMNTEGLFRSNTPIFGFYPSYSGMTLREWLNNN